MLHLKHYHRLLGVAKLHLKYILQSNLAMLHMKHYNYVKCGHAAPETYLQSNKLLRLWPVHMTHRLQAIAYTHDTDYRLWPIHMTHKLQAVDYTHDTDFKLWHVQMTHRLQAVAYTHDTQTGG